MIALILSALVAVNGSFNTPKTIDRRAFETARRTANEMRAEAEREPTDWNWSQWCRSMDALERIEEMSVTPEEHALGAECESSAWEDR